MRELSPTDSESGNVSRSGAGVTHDMVMSLPPPITATTPSFDAGRARQRPSPFDGKIPWDVYHTQFELLAQLNKWNQGEKAAHLAVSLRDEAATVLTNLPAANRQDYEALTSALESRFGTKNQIDLYRTRLRTRSRTKEEPLAGLAEDVERLVRLAYPEASESMVQVLAKDQFIDSLCDEDMRLRILQSKPVSVRDALQTALELESFQTASRQKIRTVRETRLQSAEKPTRHVSFADQHATDLLQELITAIQTLTTETRKRPRSPRRGNTRSDIICWECNQKGHRQRECPTLHQGSSRSRKRPLAELAGQSSAGISSAPKKIITKIIMKSPSMYLPQPVPSWYPHPILILTLHLHTPIILSYHPNHHLSHMIIPPL